MQSDVHVMRYCVSLQKMVDYHTANLAQLEKESRLFNKCIRYWTLHDKETDVSRYTYDFSHRIFTYLRRFPPPYNKDFLP